MVPKKTTIRDFDWGPLASLVKQIFTLAEHAAQARNLGILLEEYDLARQQLVMDTLKERGQWPCSYCVLPTAEDTLGFYCLESVPATKWWKRCNEKSDYHLHRLCSKCLNSQLGRTNSRFFVYPARQKKDNDDFEVFRQGSWEEINPQTKSYLIRPGISKPEYIDSILRHLSQAGFPVLPKLVQLQPISGRPGEPFALAADSKRLEFS